MTFSVAVYFRSCRSIAVRHPLFRFQISQNFSVVIAILCSTLTLVKEGTRIYSMLGLGVLVKWWAFFCLTFGVRDCLILYLKFLYKSFCSLSLSTNNVPFLPELTVSAACRRIELMLFLICMPLLIQPGGFQLWLVLILHSRLLSLCLGRWEKWGEWKWTKNVGEIVKFMWCEVGGNSNISQIYLSHQSTLYSTLNEYGFWAFRKVSQVSRPPDLDQFLHSSFRSCIHL